MIMVQFLSSIIMLIKTICIIYVVLHVSLLFVLYGTGIIYFVLHIIMIQSF
jgi:hypothetical protein